jgi:hypothetical protein
MIAAQQHQIDRIEKKKFKPFLVNDHITRLYGWLFETKIGCALRMNKKNSIETK